MYETTHTDGKTKAKIDYTVWSEVFTCPNCGGEVVFYEAAFDPSTGKVRDEFPCAGCGIGLAKKELEPRVGVTTLGGDLIERVDFRPVAVHYRAGGKKRVKKPDAEDLAVLNRVARLTVPWLPHFTTPSRGHGGRWPAQVSWNDSSAPPLGRSCPRVSLAVLWSMCAADGDPATRAALLFWIEQALPGLSWMNRYVPNAFSQVNRILSGAYYIPALHSEVQPRYNLEGGAPTRGKKATLAKVWSVIPTRASAGDQSRERGIAA